MLLFINSTHHPTIYGLFMCMKGKQSEPPFHHAAISLSCSAMAGLEVIRLNPILESFWRGFCSSSQNQSWNTNTNTGMCCLMTKMHSAKCDLRQFHHCANIKRHSEVLPSWVEPQNALQPHTQHWPATHQISSCDHLVTATQDCTATQDPQDFSAPV